MTDDDQLRDLFARMCRAWSDGDARAYGDCFTADCAYVAFDGSRVEGRAAVVAGHDKLFRGVLSGSALVGEVTAIRRLAADLALLDATGSVLVAWRRRPPRRRLTRSTMLAVRDSDGWRCAAIHTGRIRPVPVPEPAAFPSRVARTLASAATAAGLGWARAGTGPGSR